MTLEREPNDPRAEPIFNVPPGVLWLIALFGGVMAWRFWLSAESDGLFVWMLAFIPARFSGLAGELPGGELATWTSLFTHMGVHADVAHLMFNGASLLAFGGAIEKRIGALRMLAFFVACGLLGALTFLIMNPGLEAPMIGASGAIAGLMGGLLRFLFSALDYGGLRQLHQDPAGVPLMPLGVALQDRRVQITTLSFILMNLAAKFGLGDVSAGSIIAWETHIGGYIAGFLLFGWFDVAPRKTEEGQPIL